MAFKWTLGGCGGVVVDFGVVTVAALWTCSGVDVRQLTGEKHDA